MKYCKVTAIVRSRCLDAVEKAVIGQGARGMSVIPMQGSGWEERLTKGNSN